MELARFPSWGGFSLRSILSFALAVILTVIIGVLITSHPVHAADATWDGASLRYDGNQYIASGETKAGNTLGLAEKTPYFTYIAPQAPGTPAANKTQKAYVIYFAPGTSPPNETTATYVEFDYAPASKVFSNPANKQTITIDQAGSASGTSCAIEGIGWLACPVMTWLAEGMDNIFNVIAGYMEVQPLQTSQTDNTLYVAWNTVRGIANVAFIIAFLIIIYAQLANVQVAKYGLKKLLPRLIIAAVAINLSFIITALAVDVSNILGYSIEDMFMSMQQAMANAGSVDPNAQADINSVGSWGAFTAFIISGGTAVAVGVSAAIAATGGMVAAAAYILLPVLLGLLLALILVFLILAARQAIIIILVIIAPLAIVAYLLPNTEKWFGKWRDLFMTMLIFFPAFAFVFGGAQLAGAIIIKNADSVTMQLLGMVVQVAPLVITPLLLKLSGSVLGNIARVINNPNKGLIDRTRNWSKDRADWHRQRGIGLLDRHGNPMNRPSRNPFRNAARTMDQRKKRLADRTANAATASQTEYENSRYYRAQPNRRNGAIKYDMALQKARIEDAKNITHSGHEAHVNRERREQGSMVYQSGIDVQVAKDRATVSQNYTDAFYNNARRDHRIAAGALHASGYRVELSKDKLTTTENLKAAYYNEQRATAGTDLYAAAHTLETSKLRVETAQNTYTAAVENWKAAPGSTLSVAAQRAQSSKEHLESAQAQLQAFFDNERGTDGSILNVSTLDLENSKTVAEAAKSRLTTYITNERTSKGGALRTTALEAERAKGKQQIAETQFTTMIDEFKSGKRAASDLSAGEAAVMEEMKQDTIQFAAEKQAGVSAQYEIQRNFADVMTGSGPLTDAMLDIAQGVGGETARVRAQSQAVKAARSLDSDALNANVELLENEAQRAGTNIKRYSAGVVEAVEKGLSMYNGQFITPERLKAALQAQAKEKNMPLFERIKGNRNFDQAMINEIVALNNTNFKIAGGFGMQDDPTLNIDNFATEEEYWHALRAQRISNLANTNAAGLAGLKFGWVANSLADPQEMKLNIEAALLDVAKGDDPNASASDRSAAAMAKANLQGAYLTVRDALLNDDIRATMNDRESSIRAVEAELARIHGRDPVPSEPLELQVDAKTYSETND